MYWVLENYCWNTGGEFCVVGEIGGGVEGG
jgi:hypothetical protein